MTRVVIRDLHKLNVSTYKNLHNYSCCDGSLVVWGFSHLLKFYRLLKKKINSFIRSFILLVAGGSKKAKKGRDEEEQEKEEGKEGAEREGRGKEFGEKRWIFIFIATPFFFWRLHDERCVNFDFSPAEKLTRNLAPWICFLFVFVFI